MTETIRQHAAASVSFQRQGAWQEALHHAHECLRLAEPGSLLHVWALNQLAVLHVDTGRPRRAHAYAVAFLQHVDRHPELSRFVPWVIHVLAYCAYQERRFRASSALYRKALSLFEAQGAHEAAGRTRLNVVWALLRSGNVAEARRAMPAPECMDAGALYLWQGAMAAILAAEGEHRAAVDLGRLALRAQRQVHDNADAAEVALLVAKALRCLGQHHEAAAYIEKAATLAALQAWTASALLALNPGPGGGEASHVRALVARGSANLLHRGAFATAVG